MSIVDVVRTMKQVHPNEVLLIKVGKFYHAYGKDAYVVSFIFNYQMKKAETNVCTVGFPEVALNKVIKTLEDKLVGYLLIDRSANYEVIEKELIKDSNYSEIYNKAYRYQNRKNKIDEIYSFLVTNIDDDIVKVKINQIEDILYEGR